MIFALIRNGCTYLFTVATWKNQGLNKAEKSDLHSSSWDEDEH